MSTIAALLLGLGVADLARGASPRRPLLPPTVAGVVVVLAMIGLAGLTSPGSIALLVLASVAVVAWVVLSEGALESGRGEVRALAVPAGAAAVLAALSGWADPVSGPIARWLGWITVPDLSAVAPERALLVAGLFLVQLATGNIIVRLVLTRVGAIRPHGGAQASDHLRGGRVLGPMERVFILGLGLAGHLTAAGIVIAAKGLIRWPELRAERTNEVEVGIDEVTEYFLVGSFVSWLTALVAVAVVHLS